METTRLVRVEGSRHVILAYITGIMQNQTAKTMEKVMKTVYRGKYKDSN